MDGSAEEASPAATDERLVDSVLQEVESCILASHRGRLRSWAQRQKEAFDEARQMDDEVIVEQRSLIEECSRTIERQVDALAKEREEETARCDALVSQFEVGLADTLAKLGQERAGSVNEALVALQGELEHSRKRWEEEEWRQVDAELQAEVWKHAYRVQNHQTLDEQNLTQMVWEIGALQPKLEEEREGWRRSQRGDLERLVGDLGAVLEPLEQKLHNLAPAFLDEDGGPLQEFEELARSSQARLAAIHDEVTGKYDAEVAAAIAECEDEHRRLEAELHCILLQTLQERSKNAREMQQIQLAACTWRLDYQQTFHEHCSTLGLQPPLPEEPGRTQQGRDPPEATRARVLDMWEQEEVPSSEISRFLERVLDAAVADGTAAPAIEQYYEELQRYGALSPEQMEGWLEGLGQDDVA